MSRDALAAELLGYLFKGLGVEPDWSEQNLHPPGFTWWPGLFAQRIWWGAGSDADEIVLCVETDVARREHGSETAEELNRRLPPALSAFVYNRETAHSVSLLNSWYVTRRNVATISNVILGSAILQVASAFEASQFVPMNICASGHPQRGVRQCVSPTFARLYAGVLKSGEQPPRLTQDDWHAIAQMALPSWGDITTRPNSLEIELPYRGSRAVFAMTDNAKHNVFGSGVRFRVALPVRSSSEVANELNREEMLTTLGPLPCAFCGSWLLFDDLLCFEAFLPTALYQPLIVPWLAGQMVLRVEWLNNLAVPLASSSHSARLH